MLNRILVSKFKGDNSNHIEMQELIAILEKEKLIAEEEREKGGKRRSGCGICNIISNLSSL
jgi:hypothetical protein